jgi:hypothetical protein
MAIREDNFRIRIDDIQHFLDGYYLFWKNFDTIIEYKENPPSLRPKTEPEAQTDAGDAEGGEDNGEEGSAEDGTENPDAAADAPADDTKENDTKETA